MAKLWSRVKSNIKNEKLLNVSNFLVLTLSFFILGLFISVVVGSQTALRKLESQAQITVYFKDDFPAEKILQLQSTITQDARVDSVEYISKEAAYKLFKEINKDEPILLDSVSASILPASLEIRTKDLSDLSVLASEYAKVDGVEDVKHFDDVVSRFRFWSGVVYVIGFALVGVFFVISYAVVLATLRATINSKGVEYEIMKLVGATDAYVKQPILYQGTTLGILSGLTAGLLLTLITAALYFAGILKEGLSFAFLYGVSIHPILYSLILTLILVLSGVMLGILGSKIAIKRYLDY